MTGDHHDIILAVAEDCRVRPESIYAHDRHKNVSYARHLCAFVLRYERGLSYPEIGRELGGRDHTTAMHQLARAHELEQTDPKTRDRIRRVRLKLRGELQGHEEAAPAADSIRDQLAWLEGSGS